MASSTCSQLEHNPTQITEEPKDVRPEEWTPSYAGNSARMDFLLYEEEIVIEAKMTRKGLLGRHIVDQLVADVSRYKSHPRCKILVCFIYDPEGYIGNSAAIVSDIENDLKEPEVRVFIYPLNN